jgi:hypothetical protein
VSVVARFAVSDPTASESIQRAIDGWLSAKAELGVDLSEDLRQLPRIESAGPSHVDLVFDGTSTSRRWKDWLVELTREITEASDSVSLEGFQDLVSGRFRPG